MANHIQDTESLGAGPPSQQRAVPSSRVANVPGKSHSFIWSKVSVNPQSVVPPPRSGAASVVVQGKLYIFGGYGGGTGRLDDFYAFDFAKLMWEKVEVRSTEKPGCRENNGVVISDSSRSICLFGGYNGISWLNDLWKYDIITKRWTCIQESSDQSPGDELHGESGNSNSNSNDATNSNVDPNNRDEILPNAAVHGRAPSRRFGYVSVVNNNKFVLFGGFDGNRWCNDMYVYDFDSRCWNEIDARGELPSVRSCPAWATDDTNIYIQGGYDGVERKDDFFACDLNTYTWKQMPNLGKIPSPRYFHSCCLYGRKMYLYGGYSGSERLADMHAYDFDTNHWSEVSCGAGDPPSGRSSLVAQVYGNNLYVFGGYNGNTVLNDFYKFRLSPVGVPPPALVQDFQRLLNQPDMSDVTFVVEGKEIFAHRAILAIRSEYFRVLLFNGMRESVQSSQASVAAGTSNIEDAIELQDVSHSVFLKVLEYIYTDTVRNVSLDLGINLLIASEQFLLDRLKALCEDILRREINSDNVIGILITSHRHNAVGLKDIAMEFILRNLKDATVNIGLNELKVEPDLLVEIIRLQTLQLNISQSQSATLPLGTPSALNLPTGPFGSVAEWNTRR